MLVFFIFGQYAYQWRVSIFSTDKVIRQSG